MKEIILYARKDFILLHLIALIREIYVQVQVITFFRINLVVITWVMTSMLNNSINIEYVQITVSNKDRNLTC